ncbi:hypothetical protein PIROE2DRAFT_58593 [Piromyces sp. E2]|nr:hypothetical protein PIROE2DRAFT_58593 [Piromyces sp. E2]|eukprot:OUM67724.1 hypothetical protein PIROE2DRAFT_58593 [Piromyces sp. E2]
MTSEAIEQQQQIEKENDKFNVSDNKSDKKRLISKEYELEPANIITNIVSWAAKEKHPLAMYLMGIFFLGYYKVNPDFEKAVFWFKRAIKYRANKNFGGVEYYLGHCYENGFGIAQDTSKALELYTTAANKKFPQAMKKLSVCYAKGILGCDANKELSNMWNKMYEEGDNYVWNMNSDLSNAGYKVDMFAAEEQLIDVIEDAREVGNIEAEYCLGLFYDAGFGGVIERDEVKALQCFKTAATKGHAGAMYCLAKYNEDGKGGCPKQPDIAMKYYREAAINGDHMAKEVIRRYKYMPMDDKARAMVKEARRQRLKEEAEEELIRRNSSTSNKFKAKVQQVINKPPRRNKSKGKAPAPESNPIAIKTSNSNKNINDNNQKINDYKDQGSTSNNNLRVNSRKSKTGTMLKLSPLIEEESYSSDNSVVTTEEKVITTATETPKAPLYPENNIAEKELTTATEAAKAPLYPENNIAEKEHTTATEIAKAPLYPENNITEKEPEAEAEAEAEKELNEDEKRQIIANKVKKLSEEYNMDTEKIDNDEIFKDAIGEVNILENEVIGSDYSDSVNNYNTVSEQKVDIMEEIKEVAEGQNNDPILDNELKSSSSKSKKGFGLFKKVKSLNKKNHKEEMAVESDHDIKNIEKQTKELENNMKEGINSVPDKTSEIENEVKEEVKDVTESTGNKLKNFGNKTKDGFKSLGRKTKELGSDMKEGLDHTTSKAGKGLRKLGEKTKELSRDKKDMPEKTADLGNDIKDEVKDTTVSKGSKLKSLGEKTKDGFKSLGRKTKELGSDTKDGIKNVPDKTNEVSNDVKDGIDDATDSTGSKLKSIGEKTKDGFKSLGRKTKELGIEMKEGLDHTTSKAGKGLKKLGEKTKELGREIKDIPEKSNDINDGVKDDIKDDIKETIKDTESKPKDIIEENKDELKVLDNKTKELGNDMNHEIEHVATETVKDQKEINEKIEEEIKEDKNDIKEEPEDKSILEAIDEASRVIEDDNIQIKDSEHVISEEIIETVENETKSNGKENIKEMKEMTKKEKDKNKDSKKSFGFGFKKFFMGSNKN